MRLYRVKEVADLFIDACVRDGNGQLLLLSLYGRDGTILKFLAGFSLPPTQGGLREFTVIDEDGHPSSVYVHNADRLEKLTGRLPKANVFGELVHAFIFDPGIAQADRANRIAWGVYPTLDAGGQQLTEAVVKDRLWCQVKDLSPVPLLDAWRDEVLDLPGNSLVSWLRDSLHPPLGDIEACRIELDDSFCERLSQAVREGRLELPEQLRAPHGQQHVDDGDEEAPGDAAGSEPAGVVREREVPPIRLGQVVMTRGAEALLIEHPTLLSKCLARHVQGDWGLAEKAANEQALIHGNRLLSAYAIDERLPSQGFGDNTLWVITEWDRSVTTLLLPSEY